ncbi:acetyl-CoA hydrolase/transferase C-terminal domain-containing protein [Amycolatopsis endophytica]|uniref:Acetyl-CoA hydrolase n=1 Tax=Amycolatopsis endophytica TaxID=860233 RepID=A0A853AZR3_9PSEU|nr:acetyl-CoA hydrolase/transferase C-terminal domain-containing protein [Amycolatopsis endophytica]NYI88107.1 acetyl-CoA hydrolase [Amycolatopsis endophytica]
MTPALDDLGSLDLTKWIRAGDRLLWSQGNAEPLTLIEQLIAQRSQLGPLDVFLTLSFGNHLQKEHGDTLRFQGLGGLGANSRLSRLGVLDVHPMQLSQFCQDIHTGRFPIDVAFVQLAGPDSEGNYSAGLDHTYTDDLVTRARAVIAEVNTNAPLTRGTRTIRADELDAVVRTDRPIHPAPSAAPDEVDRRIARHVADFVPKRATLEVGIGTLPSCVLDALQHHRDLGIHTGMVTKPMLDLMESGAVTNSYKSSDAGRTTGSSLAFDPSLDIGQYPVLFRPSRQALSAGVLAGQRRMTAINAAVEVDLSGQVNAEYVPGGYVGGVGGLLDFVRGARASDGGRSVIAIRSRTSRGRPRIVPALAGGVVTVPRSDADIVVTEWGAVELARASLAERARRLISIAHPEDRENLTAAWRDQE